MDAPGLPVAAITRMNNGGKKRADSTLTGISFPAPGEMSYGWQVVVNSDDWYIFTMPISPRKITGVSLSFFFFFRNK